MTSKKSDFLRKFVETLIISFIVAIIIDYFLPASLDLFSNLPGMLSRVPRSIYILIILIVIFWYLLPKRGTWESLNPLHFASFNHRPSFPKAEIEITEFGVKWKVIYGSNLPFPMHQNDSYYHVEGPFCPVCDYELDRKVVPKLAGYMKRQVWFCQDCDKEYARPKKQLHHERDVIEKKARKFMQSQTAT